MTIAPAVTVAFMLPAGRVVRGTVRAFAIERGRVGLRVEVAARVRWWFVELCDVVSVEMHPYKLGV